MYSILMSHERTVGRRVWGAPALAAIAYQIHFRKNLEKFKTKFNNNIFLKIF